MLYPSFRLLALALGAFSPVSLVHGLPKLDSRQVPANASDVTTITSPTGAQIRYKEPGKAGVCETTPGVNSYSGYIDLAPNVHTFFWFFEARHNPETAPLTLWLNGGPGSDSLIGLFQGANKYRLTYRLNNELIEYRTWALQCNSQPDHSTQPILVERSDQLAIPLSTSRSRLFLLRRGDWHSKPIHGGARAR